MGSKYPSTVKNLPVMWEIQVLSLSQEDPLEKGMAARSSIRAWRIPWTEGPDSPRGRREPDTTERLNWTELNWATNTFTPSFLFLWFWIYFIFLSFYSIKEILSQGWDKKSKLNNPILQINYISFKQLMHRSEAHRLFLFNYIYSSILPK